VWVLRLKSEYPLISPNVMDYWYLFMVNSDTLKIPMEFKDKLLPI